MELIYLEVEVLVSKASRLSLWLVLFASLVLVASALSDCQRERTGGGRSEACQCERIAAILSRVRDDMEPGLARFEFSEADVVPRLWAACESEGLRDIGVGQCLSLDHSSLRHVAALGLFLHVRAKVDGVSSITDDVWLAFDFTGERGQVSCALRIWAYMCAGESERRDLAGNQFFYSSDLMGLDDSLSYVLTQGLVSLQFADICRDGGLAICKWVAVAWRALRVDEGLLTESQVFLRDRMERFFSDDYIDHLESFVERALSKGDSGLGVDVPPMIASFFRELFLVDVFLRHHRGA